MSDRCAEDAHHRVADELVERAAEPFEIALDAGMKGDQCPPDILRIRLIGTLGEADEVHEEDRDDAAFLDDRPRGLCIGWLGSRAA